MGKVEIWIWYYNEGVCVSLDEPKWLEIPEHGDLSRWSVDSGKWLCLSEASRAFRIPKAELRQMDHPQAYWIETTPQWVYE
jgi:hypothetical protein